MRSRSDTTARIERTIPFTGTAWTIAAGDGAVWIGDIEHNAVVHVDPATDRVVATIPIGVGSNILGVAAGDGAAWVTIGSAGTLVRIDALSNHVRSIPLGLNQPRDVVLADHKVWVSVQQPILSP